MAFDNLDTIDNAANVVLIAQNPKSGASNRGKLVEQLGRRLQDSDLVVEIIQDIDELTQKTADYLAKKELRCVVAAGGDGTVSLLVNRLPPETPFFVFPLGTANLLAKFLKTNLSLSRATHCILNGKTIRLDIGKANDQLFVVVASCGYDADVVHRLHTARKGHINYASYLLPVARSIFGYSFPKMRLLADGQLISQPKWAFVFNIPKYAVGLQFCPNADPQDEKLDVCSFAGGGFWKGLGYFFSVLFRQHHRLNSCNFHQFRKLEIQSESDQPVPLELDGDPAGFTPVTIEVLSDRLRVLVD